MWQLGLERKDARDLTYYYVGGNGHRLETMLFFKPTMTPTPLRSAWAARAAAGVQSDASRKLLFGGY